MRNEIRDVRKFHSEKREPQTNFVIRPNLKEKHLLGYFHLGKYVKSQSPGSVNIS